MARKALIVKSKREKKFKVRNYNRCELCGRPRAYLRDLEFADYVSGSSHWKVKYPV